MEKVTRMYAKNVYTHMVNNVFNSCLTYVEKWFTYDTAELYRCLNLTHVRYIWHILLSLEAWN